MIKCYAVVAFQIHVYLKNERNKQECISYDFYDKPQLMNI